MSDFLINELRNSRVGTIPYDEIIGELSGQGYKTRKKYKEICGVNVKITSQRYEVFKKSNICCVCGIKGTYFGIEKDKGSENYHLNLYGIDSNGEEHLLTKDHILPKSKGGSNRVDNYQTMCYRCNGDKGNTDEITYITPGKNKKAKRKSISINKWKEFFIEKYNREPTEDEIKIYNAAWNSGWGECLNQCKKIKKSETVMCPNGHTGNIGPTDNGFICNTCNEEWS